MSKTPSSSEESVTLLERRGSRRAFLRSTAVTAIAGSVLAACKGAAQEKAADGLSQKTPVGKVGADSDHSGGTMAAHPAVVSQQSPADQMDAMHEKGIKAFPAKTAGMGNQLLAPVMDGREGLRAHREEDPVGDGAGHMVEAWAYNDQVPGPQIRVKEGDRVRVVLQNELPESTAIHFHGLEVPNDMDGVPFITQPPVKPGAVVHVRVHRAERRLAHVPLAPQLDEAGRPRAARRVHRRAEERRARSSTSTSTKC